MTNKIKYPENRESVRDTAGVTLRYDLTQTPDGLVFGVMDIQENYTTGYVKIFRSMIRKGYYKKSEYIHLWLHLLLKANHKPNEWFYKNKPYKVGKGEFITSRKTLSKETGINESKIERILKCFENEQQIEQQNMYTSRLIKITYWDEYQKNEQVFEQPVNSQRTASEQPVNTNNNDNNVKNEKNKKDIVASATKNTIEAQMKELEFELDLYKGIFPEQMLKDFYDYWSEPNQSKTKIRKNTEKTWDTKKRLNRWSRNNNKFNNAKKENYDPSGIL